MLPLRGKLSQAIDHCDRVLTQARPARGGRGMGRVGGDPPFCHGHVANLKTASGGGNGGRARARLSESGWLRVEALL